MCTLWQRFGRAARDFSLDAIALFLVEPKHFDDTKAEKAARKEKRDGKRKSSLAAALGKRKRVDNEDDGCHRMSLPHNPGVDNVPPSVPTLPTIATLHREFISTTFTIEPSRNQMPCALSAETESEPIGVDADDRSDGVEGEQDRLELDRRAIYEGHGAAATKRSGKQKSDDLLEPAMDDMINAGQPGRAFACFRAPAMVYFGNSQARASFFQTDSICFLISLRIRPYDV